MTITQESLNILKIKEDGLINNLLDALLPLNSDHPFINKIHKYRERKVKVEELVALLEAEKKQLEYDWIELRQHGILF
jgi:hypothetical protein